MLSAAFYVVLLWARQTRALHFALMIVAFHAAALLADHFDLTISSWVTDGASMAVIGKHVIFYRRDAEDVLILRILHQQMLPGRHAFTDEDSDPA